MNTLTPLNRQTAQKPVAYPERIVQFGAGNFLRAFADWAIDILNQEADFNSGVVVVKATPGTYDALDDQDGLFHVHLEGIEQGEPVADTRLITCINRTVYPYEDFEEYLQLARQPDIRFIISNTTEAGISFDENDQFTDTPPTCFPAKLTRFLYERFQHFNGASDKGCIILPTELVVDNGTQLREMILRYADQWGLDADFKVWIEAHNLFCNTLVDRIVSGFPEQRHQALSEKVGYTDELLVTGEPYHSWVIEAPLNLKNELPFEQTSLAIKIVNDLDAYRKTKVRILNGLHISMVPLGLMLGLESVRDCVEHETLAKFLHDEVYQEIIPSMDLPESDLITFTQATFDRFHNPSIHHRLASIAVNSLSKIKARLLPTLLEYHSKNGELPEHVILVMAAFIRFYKGEWQGSPLPLSDDEALVKWFKKQWDESTTLSDLVYAVLTNTALWQDDLSHIQGLQALLVNYLEYIEQNQLLTIIESLAD